MFTCRPSRVTPSILSNGLWAPRFFVVSSGKNLLRIHSYDFRCWFCRSFYWQVTSEHWQVVHHGTNCWTCYRRSPRSSCPNRWRRCSLQASPVLHLSWQGTITSIPFVWKLWKGCICTEGTSTYSCLKSCTITSRLDSLTHFGLAWKNGHEEIPSRAWWNPVNIVKYYSSY